MKLDIGIIGDLGIQEPFALRQVNDVPVLVFGDVGLLEAGKFFQLFGISAREPGGFIKRQ